MSQPPQLWKHCGMKVPLTQPDIFVQSDESFRTTLRDVKQVHNKLKTFRFQKNHHSISGAGFWSNDCLLAAIKMPVAGIGQTGKRLNAYFNTYRA